MNPKQQVKQQVGQFQAYLAALILLVPAGYLLVQGKSQTSSGLALAHLILACIFFLLAVMVFLWPLVFRARADALYEFPMALNAARTELAQLEAIRREVYKNTMQINDDAARLQADMQQAMGQISRIQAQVDEVVALRQEKGALQREIDKWRDRVIEVYRYLERQLDDEYSLEDSHRAALERVVHDLNSMMVPCGLQLIRPTEGDNWDPAVHETVGTTHNETVAENQIVECRRWGFVYGARVLEKAQVVLAARPVAVPDAIAAVADGVIEEVAATSEAATMADDVQPSDGSSAQLGSASKDPDNTHGTEETTSDKSDEKGKG